MLGLLQCLIIGISKLLDVKLKEFWFICTVFDQNLNSKHSYVMLDAG